MRNGWNAELVRFRDSGYVRCRRCGFMCHVDRDDQAPKGSHAGYGIAYKKSYKETTITNGVVTSIETLNEGE
jgi:hypothetical protein